MSNRNKKFQDTEFQYAVLTAIWSLIVFALTVIAGAALFQLFSQFSNLIEVLTFKVPQ